MYSTARGQMSIEYVPTICPYCSCGCGIYLVVKDGRIIGQEPWKEHPINEGANCPKGKNAYQYIYSQDRLKTPLVRKNGSLQESSWEEALDLVCSKLREAIPESFGFIASCRNSNEDAYVMQKFTRLAMGTNNVEYCGRLCHSAAAAALIPAMGSGAMQTSQPEVELADCIFLAGVNLQETFPMIARRVFRAKARGAKIIYTDPRRTATARYLADIHLPLRSGTDVALINAMMSIVLNEGLEDKEFISSRTAGFDEFRESFSKVDLNQAAEITGVPLEKIREAAITYARAERGCILYDQGMSQHYVGTDNVRTHANLALLCGHAGKPGSGINSMRGQINGEGSGDMGCLCVFYPGFKRVGEESAKFFQEAWGVSKLPTKPGFTYIEMLYNCPYLYVVGGDPMMAVPDVNNVKKALEKASFLVVQDIFLTETGKLAHVVLPAATWVEREGTHTWIDRRVQKIDKVVDPPGVAKPDWWIICQLAERMGYRDEFNFSSAGQIFEEIRSCVPQYKGITYERLEKTSGGIHWPCPSEDHPGTPTMFLQKFNTPDGLGHFQAVEYKPPAEVPDEEYPYFLTTGRSIFHYHTGAMTRRTPRLLDELTRGFVEINPEDAAKEGIKSRNMVTLQTRRGRIEAEARVTDEVPPGLLFVPFHFPDSRANALTIPALDPSAKCAETKVCSARLETKQ
jgi:formate dehydrogenase alpha subunit